MYWKKICLLVIMLTFVQVKLSTIKAYTTLSYMQIKNEIIVPKPVALLVQPILDEKFKYLSNKEHYSSRLGNLIYSLTKNKKDAADEALVVLMCYKLGESQEDMSEVIARGKKMIVYLKKYQKMNPVISNRNYPNSMLKNDQSKADDFDGAIDAINKGLRGTWDNPEG